MPSLKWLRKKLLRKEKKRTALIRNRDLFPLLAADRPSILTPSTSSEHLVSFDSYGLFQRLPYEIRRSILIEASGERTLHMDLEFDHPLARKSGPQTDIRHCDLDVNLTQDTNIRKGWQWFGCVCHWPFESMLRTLGPGREFSIAVPILTWNMIEYGRFWKELDPGNELGDWICCGDQEDPPILWGVCAERGLKSFVVVLQTWRCCP